MQLDETSPSAELNRSTETSLYINVTDNNKFYYNYLPTLMHHYNCIVAPVLTTPDNDTMYNNYVCAK